MTIPTTLEQAVQLLVNKRTEYRKAQLSGSITLQLHLYEGRDMKVQLSDSLSLKVTDRS